MDFEINRILTQSSIGGEHPTIKFHSHSDMHINVQVIKAIGKVVKLSGYTTLD